MNVMTNTTKAIGTLIGDPSFADAEAIEKAEDVSPSQKRHWLTSLRQMAVYLDRPLSLIPPGSPPSARPSKSFTLPSLGWG
jgi:hypothetical protein